MRILTFVLILFMCLYHVTSGQNAGRSVRIMFLNAENAFDTIDDPFTDDDDFTPSGVRRWNLKRYYKKIEDLHKTIVAAGEWSSPEIVALCEIENRKVLNDLISGTNLSKYNYNIIHEDSPDSRGIDVCLIYRSDKLKLIQYGYWKPSCKIKEFTGRNVLHASFACLADTFHVVVNHWPSRRGGVLAADDLRIQIASMVRQKIDTLFEQPSGSKIIIAGDFNSTPDDAEIRLMAGKDLVNLSGKGASGEGTYRYAGVWETIDQVIVSEQLLDSKKGLFADRSSLKVFRAGFLLSKDPVYPGFTPFSTYRGFRYQGGVSDHLPVLIDLFLRGQE